MIDRDDIHRAVRDLESAGRFREQARWFRRRARDLVRAIRRGKRSLGWLVEAFEARRHARRQAVQAERIRRRGIATLMRAVSDGEELVCVMPAPAANDDTAIAAE